ncbi:MAG: 3'-5' exonuclease [Wolbachia sp.]
MSGSTNWAVSVLDDEEKENARKLFNTLLVFNIHEAKGLEFENVILYKFFSNKAYNEIWNRVCPGKDLKKIEEAIKKVHSSCQSGNVKILQLKDKEDKSSEKYKFYMNALYVGVSRAINGVYIVDDKECNLLKAIKPKKIVNVDLKKEKSTPEEWKNMTLKLINKGNVKQAERIKEKLKNEEKKNILKRLQRN